MKRPESAFGSAFVGTEADLELDTEAGTNPPPAHRYVVQSELGSGGMGVVYLASDRLLGRDVALKRPRADLPPAVRQQVVREAAVTARLPHPGIVPILDAGEDEHGFYYTMPVLHGQSFREWCTDSPPVAVVRALARACEALGYAHERGVVHRDVKPDNLHVGRHGEVRILDWGLAQDPAHPLPGRVGTPGYSAPEQSTGDPVGPEADVFALGRVLSHASAGLLADAPELNSIALRALAPDPADRFANAHALEQELQAWLEGERVRSHEYTVAALLRRWARRYRIPLAVGGVGLLGVLAVAGIGGAARWSEHRRAETALAGSLASGAATARAAGERRTAERLASEALAHAEDPVARGVASQWWGIPRMRVGRKEAPPCSGTLQSDGVWICRDASALEAWRDEYRLARWTPPSVVEGAAAAFDLGPEDWELQEWHWDDELGLIARMGWVAIAYSGTDERAGNIVYTQQSDNARLFDGPATISGDARVLRRLTVEGLGPELGHCERSVFDAAVRNDGAFLLACREGTLHLRSDGEAPVHQLTPSAEVYAVGWLGETGMLGSVDGRIARVDSAFDWRSTGLGAIEQFVRFGPRGWLAARDERGRVVVMDGDTLAVLDTLPGHHDAIAGGDALLTSQQGDLLNWTADPGLVPVVVDRRERGGISALDLDPTGTRLIIGHASGAVEVVQLEDGAVLPLASGASDVAKTAVWLDAETVRYHDGTQMVHHRLDEDERTPSSGAWWNRDASSWAGEPWFASTGRVFKGDYERQLDAIVIDLHRGTHGLSGLGASGTIWRLAPDGPAVLATTVAWARVHVVADDQTIRVGGPVDSAVGSGAGGRLTSLDPTGVLQWSIDLPRPVTALAQTSRATIVGTLDGGLTVVDSEGTIRAVMRRAHDRRVSFIAAHGPHVVSASWDGTIRQWNLDAVFASRVEVRAALARDR